MHFVNNLAVVIAEFTLPDAFFTSWLTCLVGGIVAACALAFYLIKIKPSENAIAPDMREEVSANGTTVGVCIATVAVFVLLWVMNL